MVPGVPCVDPGNCGQELAFCECSVLRRIFWQKYTLYVDVTYKDVDHFQKGSVHELYCLKASQVSKFHVRNVLVR